MHPRFSYTIRFNVSENSAIEIPSFHLQKCGIFNCVARATLWFCPVFFVFLFFSYAADLSLFLETGKGLTCAVFTESVDLRPD